MSRSRSFSFTTNNPVVGFEDYLLGLSCKYLVFGREIGESGTPHLQGTIVFPHQRSLKTVFKLLKGSHVEISRNVDASISYCKKDGDFVETGVYQSRVTNCLTLNEQRAARNKLLLGTPLKELVDDGEIALSQVCVLQRAKNILNSLSKPYQHPDVRGVWYWGPPGSGKSRAARSTFPDAFIKSQNKWWDGYEGHADVILDDLDTEVLGHYIKIWTDRYSCTGETKGGTIQLVHHTFVITSNYSPEILFKDSVMAAAIRRRCTVVRFDLHDFNPELSSHVSGCHYSQH